MLPSTYRFKKSCSFLLYLLILHLLSACGSGDSTLTTQTENKSGIPIPNVVSEALPENGALSAYIRVDDGPRQAMTITDGMASITLSGLTLGEHAITMEFEFMLDSNPDQPLILASANQTMNVVAGENPPLTFTNYDTESFDADGDGISNLAELSNNTSPYAGISVSPISGNTAEDGTTATFTIALTSQPQQGSDVSIGITSSDTSEGTVNPELLVFDDTNWSNPQEVTVTGEDDSIDDGDQGYSIDFTVLSADTDFDGLQPASLSVVNLDNDVIGISVSAISGNTTEAGATATFTITLISQPSADVSISISSSDIGEGTVVPESVTFTPGNWSVDQTVTVTGIDDGVADGDQLYNIILDAAVSSDANYDGIDPQDISLENREVNSPPIASNVRIIDNNGGVAVIGDSLMGSYDYNDSDEDPEGASLYQWYRNGTPISGATLVTYILTTEDSGQVISFEVTPIATIGTFMGVPVSTTTGTYVNSAPNATNVSIGGSPVETGIILTGNYTYNDADNDPEGSSTYRWLRNGVVITGATSKTYTVRSADVRQAIQFEVTPVAVTGSRQGAPEISEAAPYINKVAELVGGLPRAIAASGTYAYVAAETILAVIDITNPANPVQIAYFDTQGTTSGVAVNGSYAYVADGTNGLRILSVSTPTSPREVGFIDSLQAMEVAVSGNYAYVAAGGGGLHIIDIGRPTAPVEVGFVDTPGSAVDVLIGGNYAYVADSGSGLRIIDISDPTSPVEVGFYDTPGRAYDVAVSGNVAFVADWAWGLRIVDVSVPTSPTEVGEFSGGSLVFGVNIYGSYAYVAESSGVRILDISNPTAPTESAFVGLTEYTYDVIISGNYALAAASSSGIRSLDISDSTAPVEIGAIDTPARTSQFSLAGNFAYLSDSESGLRSIDISVPTSPIVVSTHELPTIASDIALSGNYAYVAAYNTGFLVFDISDPTALAEVGNLVVGPINRVFINENYVYVADYGDLTNGMRILDVSVPTSPTEVGVFDMPVTAGSFDFAINGNYAYLIDNKTGLHIIDISAPTALEEIGFVATPISTYFGYDIAIRGNHAYVAADTAGLRIFDISVPTAPTEVGFIDTPGQARGVAIEGNYAYVGDGDSGLRVIDVSSPSSPFEISFYDTPGTASGVAISGGHIYVADVNAGFEIYELIFP